MQVDPGQEVLDAFSAILQQTEPEKTIETVMFGYIGTMNQFLLGPFNAELALTKYLEVGCFHRPALLFDSVTQTELAVITPHIVCRAGDERAIDTLGTPLAWKFDSSH